MSTHTAGLVFATVVIVIMWAAVGALFYAISEREADRAARKHAARHWDGKQ